MSETSVFFSMLTIHAHLLFQWGHRFPMRLIDTIDFSIDFIFNHWITTMVSDMQYACNILDVDATQQVCFVETLNFLF